MCEFNNYIVKVKKWRTNLLVFLENKASCVYLAWSGLNDIFHWFAQSCILNKSLLSTEAKAFKQLTIENNEVSSEKGLTSDISRCGKSLLLMTKNKYSNTEPCTTSAFTNFQLKD